MILFPRKIEQLQSKNKELKIINRIYKTKINEFKNQNVNIKRLLNIEYKNN